MEKRKITLSLVAGAVFLAGTFFLLSALANVRFKPKPLEEKTYDVTKVVDGDTIRVIYGGREESVRLIGIDTPELKGKGGQAECYANEAKAQVEELVSGKSVRLVADDTQTDKDAYGRLLRYVFVGDLNLNKLLVEEGYAREYTFKVPYRYQAAFKSAQETAKSLGYGLWSPKGCNGRP